VFKLLDSISELFLDLLMLRFLVTEFLFKSCNNLIQFLNFLLVALEQVFVLLFDEFLLLFRSR